MVTELPGPPAITGTPSDSVTPGTTVRLMCQSRGSSPATRLIWYNGGVAVDTSYARANNSNVIVNNYEFIPTAQGRTQLECRMTYSRTGLEQSVTADIIARSKLTVYISISDFKFPLLSFNFVNFGCFIDTIDTLSININTHSEASRLNE